MAPRAVLLKTGLRPLNTARYMTGNMSYLFEFEEINDRYVAFGGDLKGGKITSKGMIITDTKCVVLSLNFKLLDESQVLLRVPSKKNMYSVYLKNDAPSGGLTCLFKKATLDESNLWHRRHWNINFKTMNKLVRGNLVRGKYDGKADEGFYGGYSVNNKEFKVFNSRTRIVEETLHITFLENKPNVVGSGPSWLFDIDTLTKSMNYKPVAARNHSDGSAGKARVETVPNKDFILIPLWTQDPLFSSSSKDSHSDIFKPSKEEEKKDAKDLGNEDYEDNVVDKDRVYGCADDPNMPNLEEIKYSYDDEDVGAEADMTNLVSYIPVSPIPTTRIYKDHLVKPIIRDIHSAPQTRRMTKNVTNYVWTLVDLSYSKRATGKKWIYRNKKDKRGIVVRKKARLVAQGYTQEKGIDYDEVFALVTRIEAIRLFLAYASLKDID
nr:ribonuclease H-like domain-containing protein [Tanacetum cinerariifolium]